MQIKFVKARAPSPGRRGSRSSGKSKEMPDGLRDILLWRRPIDSFRSRSLTLRAWHLCHGSQPLHSLTACGIPLRRARVGRTQKTRRDKVGGFSVLATSYSRTACRRTTIGAAAFHFRVRNGNGWCHYVTVTRILRRVFRHRILVN